MSFLSPYRAVSRTPHARDAFLASLIGRLCYGMVGLSLLLTLTSGGRGYGMAGAVMALFGLAVVLVSPLRAWAVDRYGPRRALPPMAAGFAAFLVAVALAPSRPGTGGDIAVAVASAAAGACAPPLGVVMRSLWAALIDDREILRAAYSLDGVSEELLNVAGPVITGVIVVVASPAAGLLASAGLAVAGAAAFTRSPALRRWPAAPVPLNTAPGTRRRAPEKTGRAIAAFVTGAAGLCLGGLGLVIVAFARSRHDPAAVAWIEAAMSAGSALGGLGYGAVTWRSPARRRLVILAAGLALVLTPAGLSPDLVVLGLLTGLAGAAVSPVLATAYLVADGLAAPGARNRAGNWVNSGYNAGNAAGAALTGQLIGRIPLAACLPVLAAPALLAVVPLIRNSGRSRRIA